MSALFAVGTKLFISVSDNACYHSNIDYIAPPHLRLSGSVIGLCSIAVYL